MAKTYADVLARTEERARVDPDFAALLARLVDIPTGSAGELAAAAARDLNEQRRGEALQEFRAGSINTSTVQDLLGLGTPQAVHRLRSRGRLLALTVGNSTWFPLWQFAGGRIRSDLRRILDLIGQATTDAVAADRIMRLARDDLGGASIAEALDRPEAADEAWAALAELAS